MSDQSPPEVTVVGLGRMGAALARALLSGGRRVTVWNRDVAKAIPLERAGARRAVSLPEAISASPVVVVCLGGYRSWIEQVQVLPAGILKDRLIVQLSTGAADEAAPLALLHGEHGAQSLDGAILGFPDVVGTEKCPIYLSGPAAVFEQAQVTIAPLGELRFLGDAIQLSNALDSALLIYAFGSMMAYLQAAALFEAAELPLPELAEHAEGVSRSFKSWVTSITPTIAVRDYAGDQVTLNTMHGVWTMARAYADRQRLPNPLLMAFEELSQTAIAAGHGEAEFAAMMEALRGRKPPLAARTLGMPAELRAAAASALADREIR